MESLRNEPVYLGGTPGTGGTPVVINTPNGNGDNGLLSTVVLASLLGGRGFGNNGLGSGDTTAGAALAYAQRAADNSSTLLTSVTKAEGDIKEATNAGLHRLQIENAAHFTNLMNRSCEVEKESIKAGYEARLESMQTKADLMANQNANTISIKDDIKDFRFSTDKQFCETNSNINSKFCELDHRLDKQFHHVEHVIDKGFDKLIEREYKEEIRSLRDKLDRFEYKETSKDLNELKHDVNRILCGLGKVAPAANITPSVLTGCC